MKRFFVLALCVLTSGGVFAAQPGGKLAKDLPDNRAEKVDVIIQFVDPPGQADFNKSVIWGTAGTVEATNVLVRGED